MTPEQFAYWLQGFSELRVTPPNADEWAAIRAHLNTVFKKETPTWGGIKLGIGGGDIRPGIVTNNSGRGGGGAPLTC